MCISSELKAKRKLIRRKTEKRFFFACVPMRDYDDLEMFIPILLDTYFDQRHNEQVSLNTQI